MRLFAASGLLGLCLAACQSTPAPAPKPPEPQPAEPTVEQAGDIWLMLSDGSAEHVQSGGLCPAGVGAFGRFGLREFAESGMDVACQYETDDRAGILTLYFSDFGPLSATEHVNSMIPTIEQTKQFTLDTDVSAECELALNIGALTRGTGPASDTEIELGATPCAVLRGDDVTSILAVRTYGDWHFKVRLTAPSASDKADYMLYQLSGEIFALQDEAIRPEKSSDQASGKST